MTEIEKLYENAGIEPTYYDACTLEDKYWQDKELANKYGTFDMYMNAKCGNQENCTTLCRCAYTREEYPPFTAEKQIAILQLLTQRCDLIISHFTEWEFIHYDGQEPLEITGKDFTETFAKLISAYWQSLTDVEKEQIRDILKG